MRKIRTIDLQIAKIVAGVGKWLNGKSQLYSKLCEEDITRKEVIADNIMFGSIIFFALAIESRPLISVVCLGIAGLLVFRGKKM